jgi:arginine decarboxylase
VLVRFPDILRHRVNTLLNAFQKAMGKHHYKASYTCVYPIKVNQQCSVINAITDNNSGHVGLEAGSKAELLAVMGLCKPGSTIICNGYKDATYVRCALLGRQMGLNIILVLEKLSELELILRQSTELGIEPVLGLRVRLNSIGKGNWQNTGGHKAKFGLQADQVQQVLEILKRADKLHCLQLLHFHIGSQIPGLDHFRDALREGARYYAELHRLGAQIKTVDVGGGLGVDYDGTESENDCSISYNIEKYAMHVVKALWRICESEGLPQPNIITESGRALTAHHAMLLTNVVDVEATPTDVPDSNFETGNNSILELRKLHAEAATLPPRATYQQAIALHERAQQQFNQGVLELDERAHTEHLFFSLCHRLLSQIDKHHEDTQDLFKELNERLADKYFCNFSLFQSLPDSWALQQIFPIMPVHRLEQVPTRRVTIEDLTCDSDGRVDLYVDSLGIDTSLPLHSTRKGEDYVLGIFMLGAYQEILGDIHNLFGDTASVDVVMNDAGELDLTQISRGDRITDVLRYVNIDSEELLSRYAERLAASNNEQQEALLSELSAVMEQSSYLK